MFKGRDANRQRLTGSRKLVSQRAEETSHERNREMGRERAGEMGHKKLKTV